MIDLLYIPWFRPGPFYIGPIPIHAFGAIVAMGVMAGLKLAEKRARKVGVSPSVISDACGHIVIAGFVLGHVLDAIWYHPEKVMARPLYVLELWNGLSSFGGFCGAIVGVFIWKWRRKLPTIPVADVAAFAFPVGWVFGRSACFTVHDHPGVATDFFMAVEWPQAFGPAIPRHDLGLYEALYTVGIVVTFFILARKERPRGFFLTLLPIIYAPVRFALDFLRAGPEAGGDPRYFGLTPGQYGSVALLVAGLLLWRHLRLHPITSLPESMRWPPPLLDGADGGGSLDTKNQALVDAEG